MKYSQIEIVQNHTLQATICLDYFNERIRVDGYRGNIETLHQVIENYVRKGVFNKVIVKGKAEDFLCFIEKGYTLEGVIPKYFQGSTAYFFTMYFQEQRRESNHWIHEDEILQKIYATRKDKKVGKLLEACQMRIATKIDAIELAHLYGTVFKVYPTPLDKSEYLVHTMEHDTLYMVIENKEGEIVSVASSEMDIQNGNAELTNCATLPNYRQYGFMKQLLKGLEQSLVEQGIYCAYTIARSLSFGMNAAFYDLGYTYGGRLTKNCYIFESIEDMNLWTKDLSLSFS